MFRIVSDSQNHNEDLPEGELFGLSELIDMGVINFSKKDYQSLQKLED